MVNSELLSAVMRGKWFISFQALESNLLILERLLNKDSEVFKSEKLSDTAPVSRNFIFGSTAQVKQGTSFNDIPKDSVAIVPIHGTMTKNGTMCNYGTAEIAQVIREAADAKNISGLILDCDSGGGSVDSIAPIIDAIEYLRSKGKTSVAHVDLCASANYYAAIYCDEIIASNNISSEIGSIGVMMSFMDYAKYYETKGVTSHTIYSDLSSYKNKPFELAKQGEYEELKKEELNPLAEKFQQAVKKRRCNLDQSVDGILQGRMFYAEDAQKYGLIDGIGDKTYALNRVKEIRSNACINNYLQSKN